MFEKLTKIFEFHQEAVFITKDGKIVYANSSAKKIFQAGFEDIAPDEIIPAQYLNHDADNYFGSIFIGGQSVGVAISRIDDYRIFIFERSEPDHFSEFEQYLFSMNAMLKESLSVWKIASDLLLPCLETMDSERLKQYAAMMRHNYYALLRITNDNSDLCDIMQEKGFLLATECDIVELCSEITDFVSTMISDRDVKIQFESSTDSFVISADCAKIEQLILKLLSNSLKNTPTGGKILLSLTPAGNRIILTVSDTGRGIPASELSTVWNRCRWPRKEETSVDRARRHRPHDCSAYCPAPRRKRRSGKPRRQRNKSDRHAAGDPGKQAGAQHRHYKLQDQQHDADSDGIV